VALIHDPDDHLEQALRETAPALARLRDDGVIAALALRQSELEFESSWAWWW